MIPLNEIKVAIIKQLRAKTDIKHVYGEDIEKKEYPHLQVLLLPLTHATAAAGQHTDRSLLADIQFRDSDFTTNEVNYEMLERIDAAIRPVIKVGNRSLKIESATMEVTDHVGHYKCYLTFTDISNQADGLEPTPLMEELGLKI